MQFIEDFQNHLVKGNNKITGLNFPIITNQKTIYKINKAFNETYNSSILEDLIEYNITEL